ncbi:hypothetical protein [Rugosimonospora africana]|uniref:Uncharacterized protein n=1 Tax=Rugosimonospora africana TaxID=556532 RepID=A0A8J3QUP7_9ACTN|nr:hypothetical protein [Rugosimonospora africana]GIH16145.1 hypothetical protein Raf01_43170 [Rugosimonospora africana]
MIDYLFGGAVTWLLSHIVPGFQAMWNLLSATLFTSPDVTGLPQVQTLASSALTIVDAGFVLAFLTAGVLVMTQHTIQTRYGINELAPRLVIGFIAANFATPLCSQLIQLGNAVTVAVTGQQIDTSGAFSQMLDIINGAILNPAEPLLVLVLVLMAAVLTGMLLATCCVRLGLLIVLCGIAPLALACHASPFTDGAARLWWRSFLGLLGTVTLQALALHTTMIIFLDPKANLPVLGIPNDPFGVFDLFIVICLLWVTIKIPGLMRRYVTRSGGGRNPAGLLVRMVLMQQLTGLLRLPLRGAGRAASAGRATARAAGLDASRTAIPYWKPRMPRPTATRPAPRSSTAASSAAPAAPTGPLVPPGVNPATAMPKRRPTWMGGAPAGATGPGSGTGATRPGVNPATAMPRTRPAWRGGAAPPGSPTPRPVVPPGTTPGTAMPKTRPAWQAPRPRPGTGRFPPPPRPRP